MGTAMNSLSHKTGATTAATAPAEANRGALRGAIGLAIVTLAGFGFLYSLAGVGVGQAVAPTGANGSLIERNGQIVGSTLVAQPFVGEGYFQPRPSAASYDLMALSGSNQARTNPEMRQRIEAARAAVAQREGVAPEAVPSDLVTQSGGGIDPHISPAAAAIQVARVARVRGLAPDAVRQLVARHTQGRQFGVLGAPRVNVLELNLALDASTRG
ncbi:potassium-transporting ATPase KdpC subunit [Pseudorhodoferax aquiterrae]|uniref:Potassium-transporting ATPase KdpC subunit n=1 Tax=Pseudorhodoferax aquiterrae TaxID=747304 RepID=A0ABQ3G932_9BURK|nr:potassium-transporting ATPase subunit KdpC [Pseudorhodoferax aquiterrae]GHC97787.1 potassium-transporting ATPase KdpC subunit [Pseudorhodoferax aquiterrae]